MGVSKTALKMQLSDALKHFLQMTDVNVVRQTGRVDEVAVKCRLLDVHIPPWRADFMHIC